MNRLLDLLDIVGLITIVALTSVVVALISYEITLRRKERHRRRLIARLERHYLEDA